MNKVKVAVIGLGSFGEIHTDVFSHLPNVEIVSVVSRTWKRAKKIANKYNIPNIFTDYREMLCKVKVDAVSVATEENRHFDPVIAALESGKHVLVEKPISCIMPEAERMIKKAKEKNLILMPGHILRFDPKYYLIKEEIDRGNMGKIVSIYARRNLKVSVQKKSSRAPRILISAIHDIDILLWYMKKKVKTVYARSYNTLNMGDDVYWVMLEFEDGEIGVIETAWLIPETNASKMDIKLEVIGTKGTALINFPDNALTLWKERSSENYDVFLWPQIYGTSVGAIKEEISYFIFCVQHKKQPVLANAEDSKYALQIGLAIIDSAKSKKVINLDFKNENWCRHGRSYKSSF